MQKIEAGPSCLLHGTAATRELETAARASLAPHVLMQRAGLAVARLALALAPHARTFWIACGPGNNGGDGLEAAMHLQQWGKTALVSWLGTPAGAPADARASHARAQTAGVHFLDAPPAACDFCIDALLGIGATRPAEGRLVEWIAHLNAMATPVLAIDLPSGLNADTGMASGPVVQANHTLSLLTIKPGLFTAMGRDASGQVWFDPLDTAPTPRTATTFLNGRPVPPLRPHASHKGSYGDIVVIGGANGMVGAALLAARAALHHGAGRVFVGLLEAGSLTVDPQQPELMLRVVESLDPAQHTVVAGCGGGHAIAAHLPRLLATAPRLVLDADALNAIAADSALRHLLRARQSRQRQTVLTPHPLEAARLLGGSSAQVQTDRIASARALVQELGCTVVLKGSGTVIAAPGELPRINPTGNALLATAGTGDVLAGMIGARLAAGGPAFEAACAAVYLHGQVAERWPADQPLMAGTLACTVS